MAEVAAGVVGIAGFGIQLAESVVKLKRFCSEVKGARRKLEGLTQELDVLVAITQDISQMHAGTHGACIALKRSLSLCDSATNELGSLVDRLSEKIQRKRLMGSVKAVMIDRELEELVGKAERTKSLLTLASNLYIREQTSDQLAAILDAQHKAVLTWRMNNDSMKAPTQGKLHTYDGKAYSYMRRRSRSQIQYKVSCRLLQSVWTIAMRRASSGWMFLLRSHHTFSWNHPAGTACWVGDVASLRVLISNGQASAHDHKGNRSFIERAAFFGNLEMIQFLCSTGVEVHLPSATSSECALVEEIWDGWRSGDERSNSLERLLHVLRFFAEDCKIDIEDDDRIDHGLYLLYTKSLHCFTIHDRLQLFHSLLHGCHTLGPCLDVIEPAMKDSSYFDLEIQTRYRPNLLHMLGRALGKDHNEIETTHTKKLEGLIVSAASSGKNPHKLDQLGSGFTPLMHVMFSVNRYYRHWKMDHREQQWKAKPYERRVRDLHSALHRWLRLLRSAGIDLQHYGESEARAFRRHWHRNQAILWDHCHSHVRIMGFQYGVAPSNWTLWVSHFGDAYAGEFWNMVEQPPVLAPGGWIDDDFSDPESSVARHSRLRLAPVEQVAKIKARC